MASSTFIYTVCHGPVLKYLDPGILGESPLSSSIGINTVVEISINLVIVLA